MTKTTATINKGSHRMLFVTPEFFVFAIIAYMLYWLVPGSLRLALLIVLSIVFYATWSPAFAVHFLFLIALNYYGMERYRQSKKRWIFVSIISLDIINLIFFKYFYFLADLAGTMISAPAWQAPALARSHEAAGIQIQTPLAISFYTFQVIAYCVDIYTGKYSRQHPFREVLLFKFLFPQLLAGPILRSKELLPQIARIRRLNPSVSTGLWLIMIGVCKKAFIADQLWQATAPIVSSEHIDQFAAGDLWLALTGLLVMLYADFAAYSDIARGIALLLGFRFPENFRAPFLMSSFTNLWQRWHLTFSRWIRDYIFIPLGGSKNGEARTYVNLVATFALAGLWHGPTVPFLVWGIVMGLFVSAEGFLGKRGYAPTSVPGRVMGRLLLWFLYMTSGVFFFAPTMAFAGKMLQGMFTSSAAFDGRLLEPVLLGTAGAFLLQLVEEKPDWFRIVRKQEEWLLPVFGVVIYLGLTRLQYHSRDFFYFKY